ncbi:hypothetical protein [Glycomyces rhizosphaerae]|uniref:Uncharacterized protein n=1 Tax=Glycomyces rhizosphaerae TaxID=2054422 RepID=A0ABV7PZ15_9ACTN
MEFFLGLIFFIIGTYVMYWIVRMGVRDGIADADERRVGSGPERE